MKGLPVLDQTRPTQPNYAISAAQNMLGKNVISVRTGEVIASPHGPEQMEAILLEFGDGSIMSIEAATNISQIVRDGSPTDARDLHVTFYVNYVRRCFLFQLRPKLPMLLLKVRLPEITVGLAASGKFRRVHSAQPRIVKQELVVFHQKMVKLQIAPLSKDREAKDSEMAAMLPSISVLKHPCWTY